MPLKGMISGWAAKYRFYRIFIEVKKEEFYAICYSLPKNCRMAGYISMSCPDAISS
jgi:hypothetical protein